MKKNTTPAQIAREIDCGRQAVYDTWKKYLETGTVHDRPRSGRKRKYTPQDEQKIIKKARQEKKASNIARESKKCKKTYSESGVRRVLKKHKFFYLPKIKVQKLTNFHKQKRIAYAREMSDTDWKPVVFTDEKSFWLGSSTTHAWQQLDKRIVEEKVKYPPKLHVWGGIGHYFKTELYFFEENLTSSLYQKIISQRLPPSTTSPDCPKRVKNYYFVQDNDPKHKTKASMKLLEEITQGRMYKHPPNSPDLNVMEDAWSYLDRCVKESRVKTISGLKQKLKKLWAEYPWSEIRASVDSMPRRLQQVLEREGGRTDY